MQKSEFFIFYYMQKTVKSSGSFHTLSLIPKYNVYKQGKCL